IGVKDILNIESSLPKFNNLDTFEQSGIILNLLSILHCSSGRVDLSLIGGGKQCGALTKGKEVGKLNIKLINQSVTGLFEQIIDLNK
ncbi:MAG: hypothetical protein IKP71_09350, partial [Candidatus Riflebacteria bacterium]|nr:hypothetical protein [Candidatus Riflebacteria bacterium]